MVNNYIYITLLSKALYKVFAANSLMHAHRQQRATTQGANLTIGSNLKFSVLSKRHMWTGGGGNQTAIL